MLNDNDLRNFILNKKMSNTNCMGTTYTVIPTEISYTRVTNRNKAIIIGIIVAVCVIVLFGILSSIISNSATKTVATNEEEKVAEFVECVEEEKIEEDELFENINCTMDVLGNEEAVFNAVISVKKINNGKGQVPEPKNVFYNDEYPKDVYKYVYLL